MLAELLTQLALVVALMLALSLPTVVGLGRLRDAVLDAPGRIRRSYPVIAVIVFVLLTNRVVRQKSMALSQDVGIRLTGTFYDLEADFLLSLQAAAREELVMYFSFIYIYGYVFLLVFPVLAYFALKRLDPFQKLLVAYALNYTIGPIIYILVVAYGPRNVIPGLETILYDFQPQYQRLTREVNQNSNVFPSLHTSLSMTIAIFAYRTRDRYPLWFPVAGLLAVSVATATVYLGIHWITDVVFGVVLAAFSVYAADVVVDDWQFVERTRQWVLEVRRERPIRTALRRVSARLEDDAVIEDEQHGD